MAIRVQTKSYPNIHKGELLGKSNDKHLEYSSKTLPVSNCSHLGDFLEPDVLNLNKPLLSALVHSPLEFT